MNSIKTILVPTDFSEPGDAALAYAVDLARPFGAKVVLLHAYELPIVGFPDGALVATADFATKLANLSQKALDDSIAKYRESKVEVSSLLKQGEPREVVIEVAKQLGADLIVMGTHGRRGLARALIGSVTEGVVRTSPVPVLTVHGSKRNVAA